MRYPDAILDRNVKAIEEDLVGVDGLTAHLLDLADFDVSHAAFAPVNFAAIIGSTTNAPDSARATARKSRIGR